MALSVSDLMEKATRHHLQPLHMPAQGPPAVGHRSRSLAIISAAVAMVAAFNAAFEDGGRGQRMLFMPIACRATRTIARSSADIRPQRAVHAVRHLLVQFPGRRLGTEGTG